MRNRILEGFKEIAFSTGFYRATVGELSSRTGISKRTIYRYFRSKDEMVESIMDQILVSIGEKVDAEINSCENPVEKVVRLVQAVSQNLKIINPLILQDIQKYYPHIWNRIEKFRAEKARMIATMILTGSKQGYFRETIPEIFITALQSGIRDVINPSFLLKNNLTLEQAVPALFTIFLYGIASDESKKADILRPLLNPENPGS